MTYNPYIHHRRSIRLKGYDYSQPGAYFITVCTHNREHLFGHVDKGKMVLNNAGDVIKKSLLEIPEHFPNVTIDEYVIMPNHVHCIMIISVGANNHSPLRGYSPQQVNSPKHPKSGTSKTIGSIVRGFKIGAVKWFRENTDIQKPWQRNYYEHIIRNENELNDIRKYIVNNPISWDADGNNILIALKCNSRDE